MAIFATEPFAFLACVSFGVYTSIVPQLTVFKVCSGIYNATICNSLSTENHKLQEKRVYDEVTTWNMICFVAIYVPSLITTMIIGALANLVSKKKLLLLPPVIRAIQTIMLILAAKFMFSSMIFVALAASLTSVYGDLQGYIVLSNSYMAEMIDAKSRSVRMTILGAMLFLGDGLGSFVAGILLKNYGFIAAFSLSISACVVNLIFVLFILPDTMPKETSTIIEEESLKTRLFNHLKQSYSDIIKFSRKYLFSWENQWRPGLFRLGGPALKWRPFIPNIVVMFRK